MRSARPVLVLGLLLLAAATAPVARAEGGAVLPPPPPASAEAVLATCKTLDLCAPCGPWWAPKRLHAQFAAGAWLARMNGELGLRGQTVEVEQSFDDVIETAQNHLDGILQGGLRVAYGRWTLGFSSSWMRLEADSAPIFPAGGTAEIEATIWQGQATLGYRLGATSLGCDPCSPWLLYDAYVGVRFMDIEATLRTPAAVRERDASWADPVIGARLAYDLQRRWVVDLQADIGGFGMASDLTWMVRVGVEWVASRRFSLKAGWIWIDTDYETGSGADRFAWDIRQDGPYLLFTLAF